jgi:hypothetical protein
VERRKGGRLSRGTTAAEAADLLAEGGVVVAEAGGNRLLAAALDADGAKGLVEPLGIGTGLEEEATGRGVVHGGARECDNRVKGLGIGEERNAPGQSTRKG